MAGRLLMKIRYLRTRYPKKRELFCFKAGTDLELGNESAEANFRR